MYIFSYSIPFYSQALPPAKIEPALELNPLNNYPLTADPAGIYQGHELFHTKELHGASPIPKHYSTRNRRLKTYVRIQHWSPGFIVHTTAKLGMIRLLEFNWWILLVIFDNMKLPPSFVLNSATENIWWVKSNKPNSWSYHEVRPGSLKLHWYSSSPPDIVISPRGKIHRVFRQSLHGWQHIWPGWF